MRHVLSLLCLVVMLGVALPAEAQLRQDIRSQRAPAQIFDKGATGFSLNSLFSPQHFRMGHSVEMTAGSFGGQTATMGMYTNSLMWQFNDKLAARVDLSYAQNFSAPTGIPGMQGDQGQFFLRNAEIAFRPNENTFLQFSFRQSPYGSYMNPYMRSPYETFFRQGSDR
jgi:hypothetical protein